MRLLPGSPGRQAVGPPPTPSPAECGRAYRVAWRMRLLAPDEVARLPWETVLDALEAAFREPGRFQSPERVALRAPADGAYLTMPCADADGWFGVKQVSVRPRERAAGVPTVHAWYTLFGSDGRPLLGFDARQLTLLRTAAVSALAARHLASPAARRLLVVGTGALAPWLARAHQQVRDIDTVVVWGRDPRRAARLAAELRAAPERGGGGAEVIVARDLGDAVRGADVISCATTAREPLVRGAWLGAGQHLDLVGAFTHAMRETDAAAIVACDVVVDQRAAARHEAGDLHWAALEGWSWDALAGDLHEVVRGSVRRSQDRPTAFKSVGLALEDLALARLLAARASGPEGVA